MGWMQTGMVVELSETNGTGIVSYEAGMDAIEE